MASLDNAMECALRALARAKLEELDHLAQRLAGHVDLCAALELGAYIAEGRRLFHGDEAPPAPALAANVRPIRKHVGPLIKKRNLLDIEVTFDSQPKPPGGAA